MNETEKLIHLQRQLTIAVLFILILALVFLIGFYFADILRILGISLILSYMVINLVDWLSRYVRNRALAVCIVYLSLIAVIVVTMIIVVPAVVVQISQLAQTTFNAIPELLQKITVMLTPLESKFHACQIDIKAVDIMNNVIANMPRPDGNAIIARVTDVAMGTMAWLIYGISISVVSFYFLLDGNKITDSLIGLFPDSREQFFRELILDVDKSLQSFFRGQIVLGMAFGLVMLAIYAALGVQYALLLAIFLGLMEVLPVIGPPIGFMPALLSVAFHGMTIPGNHLTHSIVLTIIFVVLQQLKDNIVAPKYIGNVIGLHPVMIFLAIMIGARLDGTLGIIFSLPVACVINVAFTHFRSDWNKDSQANLVETN